MMNTHLPPKWLSAPKKRLFWSRAPGEVVDKNTGATVVGAPRFDMTILDWYNTISVPLKEICEDGRTNLIVSPEAQTLLEHLVFYVSGYQEEETEAMQEFAQAGCQFQGTLKLPHTADVKVFVNPFWQTSRITATVSCEKLDESCDLCVKSMGIL